MVCVSSNRPWPSPERRWSAPLQPQEERDTTARDRLDRGQLLVCGPCLAAIDRSGQRGDSDAEGDDKPEGDADRGAVRDDAEDRWAGQEAEVAERRNRRERGAARYLAAAPGGA